MVFKFRQIICVYSDYLLNSKKEWYVVEESVITFFVCVKQIFMVFKFIHIICIYYEYLPHSKKRVVHNQIGNSPNIDVH